MRGLVLFLFFLSLLTTGCGRNKESPLKISVNSWIGYTPLFYARAKGWLDPLNIKIVNVVSLSESVFIYQSGNSDALTGTQYEYQLLSGQGEPLIPLILFDYSNGGDLIMSNTSIDKLRASSTAITAYLEMDSINKLLLEYFIQNNQLQNKTINYINLDQGQIATLKNDYPAQPTLIVTYIPYDSQLSKHGFQTIASTKENPDLFIIDSLFTSRKTLNTHRNQFEALNTITAKALSALKKDPHEYYETVKPYLDHISYEDFTTGLDQIFWIHQDNTPALKKKMRAIGFPTRDLL